MQDFTPQNHRYARLVDRYSRFIESPVLRLKFLNNALKSEPARSRWMKFVPFANELPERALVIAELSKVLPLDQQAPLGFRLVSLLYRVRVVVYGACLAATLAAGAGLVYAAAQIVSTLSVSTEAKDIVVANQSTASASGSAVAAIGSEAG
ncbi:MAG TPA: hypothetical protein VLU47_08360, partial [Blastocatellia bacterium]|nr:hypothetical protein [Blastocatellia bacterium]